MHHSRVVENIHGKKFDFSGIMSNISSRNDGLSILSDHIVNGSSENPILTVFRGILHSNSSPAPMRNPVVDDVVSGVVMSAVLMRGIASAVSVTAEAPFHRVKFLLQSQRELIKSGRLSRPYYGIKDCFIRIIKNEGLFSLWRGNSVSLIRILPTQLLIHEFGAVFGAIAFTLRKDKKQKLFLENWLTDTATYTCSYACLHPLEYAQTRLANDIKCGEKNRERKFRGLLDIYRKTLKSDGIFGIYRGIHMGCIQVIVDKCFGLLFRGQQRSHPSVKKSSGVTFSELAVLAVSFVAPYPLETVQRRMMMTSGEASKYKSSTDAFVQIVKKEGIHSLYKGFGCSLLCLIPACGVLAWFRKLRKDSNRPFGGISVLIEIK